MKTTLLLSLLSVFLFFGSAYAGTKHGCPELRHAVKGPYQFSEFKSGKVYFTDGRYTSAKLNYNYMHGAVEFIHASHDTLILTNKGRIAYIAIEDKVFFAQEDKGEMELVADFGNIQLVRKTHLVFKGSKANASEQKYSAASGSGTPTSLLISSQSGEFRWQNTGTRPDYRYKTDYYLIDRNRIFHQAKRSSLFRIYAKQKGPLSDYLKQQDVNFGDQEQLRKLLLFCSTLE